MKENFLLSNKQIVIGTIMLITCLSIYVVLFAQHPAAHDTFHELRHSIGVSCH